MTATHSIDLQLLCVGSIALIAILSAGLGLAALWCLVISLSGFMAILGTIGLIGIAVQ